MSEQTPEPEPAPSEGEQRLEALPDNEPDHIFEGDDREFIGTSSLQEAEPDEIWHTGAQGPESSTSEPPDDAPNQDE